MYARIQEPPKRSFFLFGPRGTGKTAWLEQRFANGLKFDLLSARDFQRFSATPGVLDQLVPAGFDGWVVLDEIQRVPELLNEVHRLIEKRKLRFAMTGSSARKLRRSGVNLLAGRARTLRMHPLTASELGQDFDFARATRFGGLPFACTTDDPAAYLGDYVGTYLREEVQQEGLVRNLDAFSRFLEVVSYSQASVLNMSAVARDCAVNVKLVQSYIELLEDLLLAVRIPPFTRRAKRLVIGHPKFFFFDCGVFRSLRPKGPLDTEEEIDGAALETLFLQNVRALNDAYGLEYGIHYWRTKAGAEVDFVLYGEHGLLAFEVKRSARVRDQDLASLSAFREDYPVAKAYLLHTGTERRHERGIEIMPLSLALQDLHAMLTGEH